jgi:hypothetical protein
MRNATSEIITVLDNATLQISYICKTERVRYSIADFIGNVVLTGIFECSIKNIVNIEKLPHGIYFLYMIDGDSYTKEKFSFSKNFCESIAR